MSEEKKVIELKEEDLKKVSGGDGGSSGFTVPTVSPQLSGTWYNCDLCKQTDTYFVQDVNDVNIKRDSFVCWRCHKSGSLVGARYQIGSTIQDLGSQQGIL